MTEQLLQHLLLEPLTATPRPATLYSTQVSLGAVEERELVAMLKQGDQAAFKQVVDGNRDMVYNTALGLVQSEMDAEDVAQDVFIKAYESIHAFKGESKLSTWLYRITVTKSLDHLRSKKRKKRFAPLLSLFGEQNELVFDPADFIHPGVVAEKRQMAAALFKAVQMLPEQQKVAFVLTRLEGLGHKEVSEIMNNTVPAVESLLQRAKTNLKSRLGEMYQQ